MSAPSKLELRNIAAMAVGGLSEAEPSRVLSLSLNGLKHSVSALVSALELGGIDKSELQEHLIHIQYRCEALESLVDTCIEASYRPLDDADEGDRSKAVAASLDEPPGLVQQENEATNAVAALRAALTGYERAAGHADYLGTAQTCSELAQVAQQAAAELLKTAACYRMARAIGDAEAAQ